MNLTLLLDLDNTLLDSNMDDFVPVYFQAFSNFLKDWVSPDQMLPALIAGTRKMMVNNDPSKTLRQVFDAEFFPRLGIASEELQPVIDCFYEEVFPTLHYLTSPRPEAVELVEWAFSQGINLAVATNPLFPLAAIHHRMRWAGLPPEDHPFEVVSSYESFHFSKPHPAYFAEILGRMGWPDTPVLMVGDDPEHDLPGCQVLGLPAYWINTTDAPQPNEIELAGLAGYGSIADLRSWLESAHLPSLEPAFSSPEALTALMLAAPASVSGLLPSLSKPEQADGPALKRRPAPKEWSVTDILCHLRDTEAEVNLPHLRLLLEQDVPFIPARATDDWADERAYNSQDAVQALHDFTVGRIVTVEFLQGLEDEWRIQARDAIFGPTNLQEVVKFMVKHDMLHIRQLKATLEQVGH